MVRGLPESGRLRAGEALAVLCHYGRQRVFDGDQVRQIIGEARLDGIEARLRCRDCGTRPPRDVWVTWSWVGQFSKDGRPKRD